MAITKADFKVPAEKADFLDKLYVAHSPDVLLPNGVKCDVGRSYVVKIDPSNPNNNIFFLNENSIETAHTTVNGVPLTQYTGNEGTQLTADIRTALQNNKEAFDAAHQDVQNQISADIENFSKDPVHAAGIEKHGSLDSYLTSTDYKINTADKPVEVFKETVEVDGWDVDINCYSDGTIKTDIPTDLSRNPDKMAAFEKALAENPDVLKTQEYLNNRFESTVASPQYQELLAECGNNPNAAFDRGIQVQLMREGRLDMPEPSIDKDGNTFYQISDNCTITEPTFTKDGTGISRFSYTMENGETINGHIINDPGGITSNLHYGVPDSISPEEFEKFNNTLKEAEWTSRKVTDSELLKTVESLSKDSNTNTISNDTPTMDSPDSPSMAGVTPPTINPVDTPTAASMDPEVLKKQMRDYGGDITATTKDGNTITGTYQIAEDGKSLEFKATSNDFSQDQLKAAYTSDNTLSEGKPWESLSPQEQKAFGDDFATKQLANSGEANLQRYDFRMESEQVAKFTEATKGAVDLPDTKKFLDTPVGKKISESIHNTTNAIADGADKLIEKTGDALQNIPMDNIADGIADGMAKIGGLFNPLSILKTMLKHPMLLQILTCVVVMGVDKVRDRGRADAYQEDLKKSLESSAKDLDKKEHDGADNEKEEIIGKTTNEEEKEKDTPEHEPEVKQKENTYSPEEMTKRSKFVQDELNRGSVFIASDGNGKAALYTINKSIAIEAMGNTDMQVVGNTSKDGNRYYKISSQDMQSDSFKSLATKSMHGASNVYFSPDLRDTVAQSKETIKDLGSSNTHMPFCVDMQEKDNTTIDSLDKAFAGEGFFNTNLVPNEQTVENNYKDPLNADATSVPVFEKPAESHTKEEAPVHEVQDSGRERE